VWLHLALEDRRYQPDRKKQDDWKCVFGNLPPGTGVERKQQVPGKNTNSCCFLRRERVKLLSKNDFRLFNI
jgi:hypothetical protein